MMDSNWSLDMMRVSDWSDCKLDSTVISGKRFAFSCDYTVTEEGTQVLKALTSFTLIFSLSPFTQTMWGPL